MMGMECHTLESGCATLRSTGEKRGEPPPRSEVCLRKSVAHYPRKRELFSFPNENMLAGYLRFVLASALPKASQYL
jgi:hypothetical protein